MPTYVYRCQQCGNTFEAIQGIREETLTECSEPSCEGHVQRVIQAVGVTYNGSGFHCTDYSKSGRKAASYKDYSGG